MTFDRLLDVVDGARSAELRLPAGQGHDLEFGLAEYGHRYATAVALMEALELDALVLAQANSVRYYTGLQSWLWMLPPLIPIVALLPRDPALATLVDTSLEKGGVQATTWIAEPVLYGLTEDPVRAVVDALAERGLERARLGLELGLGQRPNLSPNELRRLQDSLPGAEIVDAAPMLWAQRAIKSPAEIERLREATRLSQIGFRAALDALRTGVTEAELTRTAVRAMLEAGARPSITPMTLIFLAGPERYRQIVQPSIDRAVQPGEQVFMDGGCSVDGYRADFIRSGVIGRLTDSSEHWYEVAVNALAAAVEALAPGRPLGDSWAAAQRVFDDAGVGSATLLPDQVGHSVGLDHWELPLVARPGTEMGDVQARPGMVLCVEPTIVGPEGDAEWRDGLFVAEDQVLITEKGAEVLTSEIPTALVRV